MAMNNPASKKPLPRWFMFSLAGIEIGAGLYCIANQFNTTRDSIFGIMQAGTQVPAKMSTQQLLDFLSGNASKLNSIAFTIALVTQVVFWWMVIPEMQHKHPSKLRRTVAGILLAVEVLSDIQFASGTNVVITGDFLRVLTTGGSAWLGILLYAVCLSFGSSFVFINGIRVLGEAIDNK